MFNFQLLIRATTVIYAMAVAGIVWCASAGWYRPTYAWIQTYASDKWLHFVLVGLLTLLLNLSFNLAAVSQRSKWLLWGTSLMLLLATLEEASQYWLSYRTFDLGDLACNYLGILIFGHLPWLFPRSEEVLDIAELRGAEFVVILDRFLARSQTGGFLRTSPRPGRLETPQIHQPRRCLFELWKRWVRPRLPHCQA